jgi:hypothetical protein
MRGDVKNRHFIASAESRSSLGIQPLTAAALSIPPALSDTLVPLADEIEALTCHAAAYVPSAGPLPKR